jgi:hypothetical protein
MLSLINNLFKLISYTVVSDPLAEYEADPDPVYAGTDPETGDLPLE